MVTVSIDERKEQINEALKEPVFLIISNKEII